MASSGRAEAGKASSVGVRGSTTSAGDPSIAGREVDSDLARPTVPAASIGPLNINPPAVAAPAPTPPAASVRPSEPSGSFSQSSRSACCTIASPAPGAPFAAASSSPTPTMRPMVDPAFCPTQTAAFSTSGLASRPTAPPPTMAATFSGALSGSTSPPSPPTCSPTKPATPGASASWFRVGSKKPPRVANSGSPCERPCWTPCVKPLGLSSMGTSAMLPAV